METFEEKFSKSGPIELNYWLREQLLEADHWGPFTNDLANTFLSRVREVIYEDLAFILRDSGFCPICELVGKDE